MKFGIIYKVSNVTNGEVYIGQTITTLNRRKQAHYYKILYLKDNTKLYNAIRKYGFDNFKWEVIYKDIPGNMLNIAEICAIYVNDSYDNGYNCTFGGDENPATRPEIQKKMSENHFTKRLNGKDRPKKGKKLTEVSKKLMSDNHWTKRPDADKIKAKINESYKTWLDGGGRKIISQKTKEGMNNVEVRKKCSYWTKDKVTDEKRENHKNAALKLWQDGDYRKRISESIKNSWHRRRNKQCQ